MDHVNHGPAPHDDAGGSVDHLAAMAKLPIEEREAYWYQNVYRGDVKQLTVRAVIMGMILGAVMSVSNLYVGLLTGWGFGVTITAGILAFAIFKIFERVLPGGHFTDLENNAMQSAASAAGTMSSAGLVSAIPALMLLNGTRLGDVELAIWIGAISFLGVVVAVPLKRQMINIDQLPFPSGIAAAETIKSLHGHGEEAMQKAKALAVGGVLGALVAYFKDAHVELMKKFFANAPGLQFGIPAQLPTDPDKHFFRGIPWDKLTLGVDLSLLLYAAGAIIGMRTGLSLLIGAVLNWFFIAPWLIENKVNIAKTVDGALTWAPVTGGLKQVASWTTWPGTGMLVIATMVALALQWKSLARAFAGLGDVFKGGAAAPKDDLASKIEVPGWWFVVGLLVTGLACVIVQAVFFKIHWVLGIISVIFAVVLSMVTTRVAGETDIAPLGAMGKMTQFFYAIASPGQPVTNLMTANVTAGAASHTSDLLGDLKSGYILGAKPRQQFFAQLFGVAAGTLACVPAYNLLVPNADVLGTKFAAPAALIWKATAEVLSFGLQAIPPSALNVAVYTIIFGIAVTLLEHFVPASRKWLPSPTGLGLGLVLPFGNSFSIFLGALVAWIVMRVNRPWGEKYIIPVSSGVIAGESLMAVVIIALFVALKIV
jgi:OPT family oligopeptide transporter